MSVAEQSGAMPPQDEVSSVRMILTLGLVSTLSGALIVLGYQGTLERINSNKRAALERAVFEVIPGATQRKTFAVTPDGLQLVASPEETTYPVAFAGYDASGALRGVAIEAAAQGYQDVIRVLYGYSPTQEAIIGFTVLESKETPGLGDKIASDPHFLANFNGLDVSLDAGKAAVANPIEAVKNGQKEQPWQIDGISGATISSKAVARMLRESTTQMAPYLAQHGDALEQGGVQ